MRVIERYDLIYIVHEKTECQFFSLPSWRKNVEFFFFILSFLRILAQTSINEESRPTVMRWLLKKPEYIVNLKLLIIVRLIDKEVVFNKRVIRKTHTARKGERRG